MENRWGMICDWCVKADFKIRDVWEAAFVKSSAQAIV